MKSLSAIKTIYLSILCDAKKDIKKFPKKNSNGNVLLYRKIASGGITTNLWVSKEVNTFFINIFFCSRRCWQIFFYVSKRCINVLYVLLWQKRNKVLCLDILWNILLSELWWFYYILYESEKKVNSEISTF